MLLDAAGTWRAQKREERYQSEPRITSDFLEEGV